MLIRLAIAVLAGLGPFALGAQTPQSDLPATGLPASPLVYILVAIAAVAILAASPPARRLADRLRRCPACGARGVRSEIEVIDPATSTAPGKGKRHLHCPHCGHTSSTDYTIARRPRRRRRR